MPKFPVDAPKQRVIKALELLGFRVVREREHVLNGTEKSRWNENPFNYA